MTPLHFNLHARPVTGVVRIHHLPILCLALAGLGVMARSATLSNDSDFFSPDRVVRVQVTVAPADWEKLRLQEHDAKAEFSKDRLNHTPAKPYTWFAADVTLDGTTLTNVGIRKRGFFGSVDKDRPGFNLQLDRFVKGRRYAGCSELKLHNNKQDSTGVRQVLAYRLFRAAGVPAPRCNLAHVTVNGTNLGLYSNIEPVDARFLRQQFDNNEGNLYEAQVSDFRPGWTATFERKNNKSAGREDLDAVAAALQADDDQLLDRLGRVIDLDAFINFWALEVLINHWDGFNGDLNNCFVYHDLKSDRLRFIPWGTDSTFALNHFFVPFQPPASVWAVSLLSRRLYNHPVTRQKYRDRLRELLTKVWDEKQLLAEADRLISLAAGLSTVSLFQRGLEMSQFRQFIKQRRSILEAELEKPATPWNHPARRELYTEVVGKVSAEFSTSWVPNALMAAPGGARARVTFDFYGRKMIGDFTDVKAVPDILNPRNAAIALSGSFPGIDLPVSIWMSTSTNLFRAGATLAPGASEGGLIVVAGQIGKPDFRILGTWETGAIRLEQAERTAGATVSGNLEADLSGMPWEDFDLAQLHKAR